jgi:hypothetical protein
MRDDHGAMVSESFVRGGGLYTRAHVARPAPHIARARPLKDRATLIVAATFAAIGAVLVLVLPGADDEGYLAFIGARVMLDDPIAGFFFQKIHPALSAFYAPAAALGWTAYRLAHVLVAASALWLVGDAVDRLGGKGTLAAALVALSPAFLLAAVAGQSNTDGVFFFAAVLNLHTRGGRAALAGAALAGFALWTRYETAPMLAAVVVWGLFEREGRIARALALAAFPLVYVVSGAAYHGDALWLVHFTPNVTAPVPANPVYGWLGLDPESLGTWFWHVTLAAPAWPVLVLVRWKKLPVAGRVLLVALGLQAAAMLVLPLLRMFFEGLGPRYMLVLAPPIAIVLALGPLASKHTARFAIAVALVLTMLSPLLGGDVLRRLGVLPPESAELLAEVEELRDPEGVVYTNDRRLSILLHESGARVRFVPHHDVLFELHRLANHDNGQYERIIDALDSELYGGAAWPCDLGGLDPRDRFVLADDDRLRVLYPSGYWNEYTDVVHELRTAIVRRPKQGVSRMLPPAPPPNVPSEAIWGPCGEDPGESFRAPPDTEPRRAARRDPPGPSSWNGIAVGDDLSGWTVSIIELREDEPRVWVVSRDRWIAISVVERGARSEPAPFSSGDYDLYFGGVSGSDRRPTGASIDTAEIEPALRALAAALDE